jgi:hypothetical protein
VYFNSLHYLFLYQNKAPHVATDNIIQTIIILDQERVAGLRLRFAVYKKEGVNATNTINQMTLIDT